MQTLYNSLKEPFGLSEFTEQRSDLAFVSVSREQLRPLLLHLRDREGFTHLVLLTAVDWIEDDTFQLTYLLNDRTSARDLGLRLMLPREQARWTASTRFGPPLPPTSANCARCSVLISRTAPGSTKTSSSRAGRDIPPYRRDFDTLKYAQETYLDRPGRETQDPAAIHETATLPGWKH